jgi:hypothetical protein
VLFIRFVQIHAIETADREREDDLDDAEDGVRDVREGHFDAVKDTHLDFPSFLLSCRKYLLCDLYVFRVNGVGGVDETARWCVVFVGRKNDEEKQASGSIHRTQSRNGFGGLLTPPYTVSSAHLIFNTAPSSLELNPHHPKT